ncbi:MAG TPA: hypothetical protein VH092_22810, partial [Urbifossiella sp.]|nr:hypothetical protein [Urbifossiella sp.]
MPDTRRLRVESLEDRLTPASAGSLDPTFGNNGIASFTTAAVERLAVVPDGRILALISTGTFVPLTLERYEPNGAIDTSFGTNGAVTTPVSGSASSTPKLTALPDGGALIAWEGVSNNGFASSFDVVRVTAAGAIDTTFGTGGTAVVPLPANTTQADLAAIVVQSDGQILVAGDETPAPLVHDTAQLYDLVVARLTATGQADTSFGTGGTAVLSDPTGTVTTLQAGGLAVQPDGRIVVAGDGSTSHFLGGMGSYEPAAVRLTVTGQFDPSFGNAGIARIGFPQAGIFGTFQSVSVLADGGLLLAGNVLPSSGAYVGAAARLTAAGQLDPSYGTAGLAVTGTLTPNGAPTVNTAIDSSGRAVFDATSFTSEGNVNNNNVFRLTADGAVDTGFGTNGEVAVSSLPGLNTLDATKVNLEPGLAALPNGDILLGGTVGMAKLAGSTPPAGFVAATTGTLVAGGPAGGTIQVLNPTSGTYSLAGTVTAFPGFAGNVRVATADVNGDGIPDYIFG